MDTSKPNSPLYETSSLQYQEDIAFCSNNSKPSNYTQDSKKRKRIYGEEYKELTLLDVTPRCKVLKVEPLPHEEIVENCTTTTKTQPTFPHPTPTEREYQQITLNVSDMYKLCELCYSISCICHIFNQK